MSRSYCFTINNPEESDRELIKIGPWRYAIAADEVGKEGTAHIQGYIELNKTMRLAGMKKLLPRAHLEKRKGTREQARDYCKKDGKFIEYGNWEKGGQGARNDLREVMTMIKEHKPMREIMETLPETVARNMKFTEKYQQLVERDETREFRKVEVHVLVGDAGCGKSRIARELCKEIFPVNPEDSFPFDGYDGEDAIVIDDYSGQFRYKHLLRILDGHQLRLNIKGGHRYAKYTKVFITSDKRPGEWYNREYDRQLHRRISSVTEFRNEEAGNTIPPLLAEPEKINV